MGRDPDKIISIKDKLKQRKKEERKLRMGEHKRQLKEWLQFAGLLFLSWLIMRSCGQIQF